MSWRDRTGVFKRTWEKSDTMEVQPGKTLWDWLQLLIVPAILVGLTFAWSASQTRGDNRRADRQTQDAALNDYLKQMSDLILTGHLRPNDKYAEDAGEVARAITLTTLRRLDGARKGEVVRFLSEAKLITGTPVVSLNSADLTGAWVTSLLTDADLQYAILTRAHLKNAVLENADLQYAALTRADLENAVLENANLTGAQLENANVAGANLKGANLTGAHVENIDLANAVLTDAFLSYVDFTGVNLRGADLKGADLRGADLTDADLRDADFTGARLTTANLSGARNSSHDKFEDADLAGAHLRGAHLAGGHLRGAHLGSADLTGAHLTGADLRGADLTGAHVGGADLTRAHLRRAYLTGADLGSADLTGADLGSADLTGADLRSADLTGAHLRGVKYLDLRRYISEQLPPEWSEAREKAFLDSQREFLDSLSRKELALLNLTPEQLARFRREASGG